MAAKKPRAMVLLGAGASAPFLRIGNRPLTTQSITEHFAFNTSRWRRVWAQVALARGRRANADVIDDRVCLKKVLGLIRKTANFLDRASQLSTSATFEPMIHLVDRASALLFAQEPHQVAQLDACLPALLDEVHGQAMKRHSMGARPSSWGYGWAIIPSLAREAVLSVVLDAWTESHRGLDDAVQVHQRFYRRLAEEHSHVAIYSLNYDPLLLEALDPWQFITGFTEEGAFIPERFYNPSSPGSLAFLHGHVGFAPGHPSTSLSRNYRAARAARIGSIVRHEDVGRTQKGLYWNAFMITGLDKFDAFSREPFSTYMLKFSRDAQESDHIIIIGTSLADNHLSTFLINTTILDPSKKVIFVDLCSPRDISSHGETTTQRRLYDFVGALRARHPSLGMPWEGLAEDIRRHGYGKLANRVLLYSCGTKGFYRRGSSENLFEIID